MRFKNIKLYCFFLLIVFMVSFMSVAHAADKHGLSYRAIKCPISTYETAGTTGDDLYWACFDDYVAGNLDTYMIGSGDNIDPGTVVLLIIDYTLGSTSEVVALNTYLNYNSNYWTPINDSTGSLFYYYDDSLFPAPTRKNTGWVTEMSVKSAGNISILSSDITNYLALKSDIELGYVFLKLNETVSAGQSVTLSFGTEGAKMSDKAANSLEYTTTDMTLSVYGSESQDASLKTLTVSNGSTYYTLDPIFTPGDVTNSTYTTVVPNNITSVDIDATVNNEYATVLPGGLGPKNLNVGKNTFSITVSSQLGNTQTYQVHVYRLSNDTSLSNLTLSNGITLGQTDEYTYVADIPYKISNTTITATPNHENAFVEVDNTYWELTNYGANLNTKNIVVKAENCLDKYASVEGNTCSSQTYTIEIEREEPSNNNYLSSLTVDGTSVPNFDKTKTTYTLANVSTTKTEMTIGAVVEDIGKATIVSGTGKVSLNIGDNAFDIVVKAEDGEEKTYTINVRRLSDNINLSNLTVTSNPQGTLSPTFSSSFYGTYTYTYDSTVTSVTITATVEDTNKAKIALADISTDSTATGVSKQNTTTETYGVNTTKVAVTVTAEDGNVGIYYINLTRAKSSNNYLSGLSLTEKVSGNTVTLSPSFNSKTFIYTATVDGSVENVDVTATPEVSYAKVVSITGNTDLDFGLNTIEVTVEAENGVQTSYIINLTREKYDIATLSDLKVDGVTVDGFNSNTFEYTLDNVPFTKDSIEIQTTKTNSYATVTGDGTVNLNTGDNTILVKVTAQNGTDYEEYKINVYREKNSDNTVHGLTVAGVVPTLNTDGTYSVTLPNSKDTLNSSDVVITTSDDAKITQDASVTLSTKNVNQYNFSIKAENGEEEDYIIYVTRTKSRDTTVTRVTAVVDTSSYYCLMDGGTSCTITLPALTTSFKLNAIFADEATISPVNGTSYNITSSSMTIPLTVTAEDGTIGNYNVNIVRQKSSNNYLSGLILTEKVSGNNVALSPTFNSTTFKYTATVDGSVENVDVTATPEVSYAKVISVAGNTDLDFGTNTIEVVVQAEDGTKASYFITLTRKEYDIATLDDLKVDGVTVDGFNSNTFVYTLANVPFTKDSIEILATKTNQYATVVGDGTVKLNTGDNTIKITVAAQNGIDYEQYIINVYREKNSDNTVHNLTVAGVAPTLNADGTYSVTLPNSKDTLNKSDVSVTVSDDAKVVLGDSISLSTKATNTYQFSVTSEDGVTKVYSVLITREPSNDSSISKVTLTIGTDSSRYCIMDSNNTCKINVPVDTSNFSLSADIHDEATISPTNGTSYPMPASESTKSIQLIVTAENNTSTVYTVNVERQKSSNNNLSDLKVDGVTVPGFDPSKQTYDLTVDGDTDKVNVSATVEDTGKSTIVTDLTQPFNLGFDIRNQIEVTVKAEDGTEKTYTIYITRSHRQDITLKNLTINGVQIDGFTATKDDYTLNDLPYNTHELDIEATPNDDNATKTGDGKVRINTGSNDITITVIAHDPTVTHDYVIHVNRELNNDTGIKGMTLTGVEATYNSTTKKYEVTVPNSVVEANSSNLIVEVNDPITTLDKKATYTVPTTPLLTTQTNDVIVTVTAEDGTINTHTLIVTREKSDVATLSSLTVTNGSFNPSFKSDTFEYVVAVPVDTTDFTVTGVVTEPHAKIVSGDGYYTMTQSKMVVEVVVESEDSSKTIKYKLNIERQKSSNNNLSDLKVDGVTVTGFNPSKQTYDLTVDGDTDKVNVSATVEDTGKSTIVTDLTQPFNLGFDIRNQIEVTVKAEDGTEKTYTIYITRSHRQDITLKNLTINGVQIDGFTKTKDDYTLNDLPYNTHQLNIEATPNDDNATKTGDGLIRINTGSNDITITVIAHDPEVTHDYVIHVNRELNNDTGIKGMTLAGVEATYNSKTKKYEVTVPNSVVEANSSNLIVEVNDPITTLDKKATYTVPTTPLLTTQTNDVIVTVTAEDGTIKTYTLEVTREKSDVATLSSLTVTNGSFNPSFKSDTFEYVVTVPVDTTDFDVAGVVTEPHANITSGIGHYTMDQSTKYIEVVVASEDLSKTNIYKLNVVRTKSSDNTLSDIIVSEGTLNPVFSSETTSYTVNVAGNIDSIDIGATLNDSRATIVSGPGTYSLIVGDNPITIHVQSESGASLYYNINVVRSQKEDNNLLDLTVDGSTVPGFDKDTTTYTLNNVGYSKTTIDIGATLSDNDATVVGLGTKTLKTGLNTFDVVVTAQNGTIKTYTINITREKNNNAYLNILAVNGYVLTPNFDSGVFDYEVTVDSTKETLSPSDVTAVAKDSNASISKQAEITLSTTQDNYYKVTVTAEDGITTQDYTIKVIRPKSSDTSLARVNVTGATISPTFDPTKKTYTVTVPYGSTGFDIEGIANDPKTTVLGNGTYTLSDRVVTLTTVSEDGSTDIYTFNIIEALSNDATLSDLSVSGYPLDKTFKSTELSYSIGNIPYGTTQLKVNASATNVSATIEYYVDGQKQDSNIVNIPTEMGSKTITVKIIAADGITTKSYTIDYVVVPSSNAYLSSLIPSEGTIDFLKTTTYYELTVDNDVTDISFDITTEDSNSIVTFGGTSFFAPKTITVTNLSVGNNNVSVLVTAQDGTTKKIYEVVVKRLEPAASSDANLSSLSVENYPLDKTFDIDTLEYSIGKIPFALTELTINATPNVGTSTINYLVNGVKQTGNKVTLPKTEGNGAIVVKVTAEDGKTIRNYKITYEKVASTNAYLSNIIVSSGTLTPNFNKNTFNYTVDVDSTTTSIDITAITEDQTAIMQMNKVTYTSPHTLTLSPLANGANEVIIIVTAENGNVLTYKVTINKKSDLATTITSEEYGHTIVNGYIKTVKLPTTGIELKNQLDNPNEYLEIWTADESAKVEDAENLATGMIVKLMINGEEKDRKVIVIKGDTSGDGEIDLFDAVKILNHYLVKTPLTGAYLEAAYVNDDTEIDLFDSVMILNHYLGKISLH